MLNYLASGKVDNMKNTKMMSFLLAILIFVCSLPLSVMAADVVELEGERTAFVSTFGKLIYNGKSYASFRKFDEALNALGKEGGRIVVSGNFNVGEFKDVKGRAPVTIVGVGSNAMGNLIDFSGNPEIVLEGNLGFGNVNIKTDEGAYILTNGYALTTFNNFDTYHTIKYVETGDHITTYHNPPSVAPGSASDGATFALTDGNYSVITAGSVNSHNVSGNTLAFLEGGVVELAVAGNSGNGTTTGDTRLVINGGDVQKIVAGSVGGTVNGNIFTEINGGKITEIELGASANAVVNGNIVLAINGGEINAIKAGTKKISGKTVVILDPSVKATVPAGSADYVIKIAGGKCEPKFQGDSVKFFITDKYGIPATEITLNGEKVTAQDSLYTLNKANNEISVAQVITLALNENSNYVAGYEDNTFRPQNNMTRAEAITLLSRLLVDENYIKGHIKSEFADVEDGAWYESYIGFFEKLGYLDLISLDYGLKIAPNELITRAEFTQLIYEMSAFSGTPASMKLRNFVDVPSDHAYAAAIMYAVSNGIVSGYEDGSFRPSNNITRAEVVTMVNRLLGRVPNGNAGTNNFGDIAGHWANGQILAACNPVNVSWTKDTASDKYELTGTTTKDYVIGLYEQSSKLSAQAIRDGVDTISEQVKKNILSAPDTLDTTGKKVIYISEKNGNDENDGLSVDTPLKTISGLSKIRFLRNAVVLFERGGIYRGQLVVSNNVSYGAYGTGDKPLLMQSKRNYADEALWQETEYPNVYVCTELLTNVGVIGFDHDLFDYTAASYDEKYGLIMNKYIAGFKGVEDMNKDLQFYSEFVTDDDINTPCKLYVYSTEGNPGKRFKSIEIGEKFDIVDGTPINVVIENLAFKFTGAHAIGINGAENFTVRNCVFSWLGGSVLSTRFFSENINPVNYGNAIETGTCNGYYLDDNWMYQLYDTGVTHQCSKGAGTRYQRDIRYSGNLIEYVHWGIEFYNSPEGKVGNDKRLTDGVHTAYNICRFGGYGWGSIVRFRQNSAQLYCGSTLDENKNQLTEYNIFDRCAGNLLHLPANSTEVEDKNIYIQTLGKRLGNLKGVTVTCDYDAAEQISNKWGDKNAVVIVIDPEKEPFEQYNK